MIPIKNPVDDWRLLSGFLQSDPHDLKDDLVQTYLIDKSSSISLSRVEFPSFDFSEKASLGTNREITQPPPEVVGNDSIFLRLQKWIRLALRREIIQTKEAKFCHRGVAPLIGPGGKTISRQSVDVMKREERFSYQGLFTCGNVWQCPVCASKISERRRIEINHALAAADEKGLSSIHATFTAPHHLGENLHDLIEEMCHAKRLMQNRKPWKRLAKSLGLVGTIRALEVTFSWNNGWHVHFHVMLFFDCKFDEQSLLNLQEMIFPMWRDACLSAGLNSPSKEHGVILNDHASDYVGKWGSEHEMTKAHIKKGHEDSLTPFQFLDAYGAGDERYKEKFLEYAKEFKGKKQLVWSRGLRELLGLTTEISDQEIAESEDPDAELFARIPVEVWLEVAKKEKQGELLEICRSGENALKIYLERIMSDKK